jgi:hypothetical protein
MYVPSTLTFMSFTPFCHIFSFTMSILTSDALLTTLRPSRPFYHRDGHARTPVSLPRWRSGANSTLQRRWVRLQPKELDPACKNKVPPPPSDSQAQFLLYPIPGTLAGSMQWARAASCQCAGEQYEGIQEEERRSAVAIGDRVVTAKWRGVLAL